MLQILAVIKHQEVVLALNMPEIMPIDHVRVVAKLLHQRQHFPLSGNLLKVAAPFHRQNHPQLGAEFTTLTKFLRDVNYNVFRDSDDDRFITMGCCLIDKRGGLIEFGRAGHTDLILHIHGHLRRLSPDGTALGMLPDEDAEFDTICLAVDHGSSVMLYSDGLSEALNHDHEEFGSERLVKSFKVACEHRDTPSGIIDEVMAAVHEFEYEQNDDQTMVLIRRQ